MRHVRITLDTFRQFDRLPVIQRRETSDRCRADSSMVQINAFSVIDLLTAIIVAALAVAILYRYWRVTRRSEDGLLAIVLLLGLAYCLTSLAVDNVVPSGMPAAAVPHAAARTLFLYRIIYIVATFVVAAVVHFGLRYCQSEYLRGWRAIWLYIAGLAICPLFWSDHFLRVREEARSFTSSWRLAVPWQPDLGGLVVVFLAFWLAGNLSIQFVFWGRRRTQVRKTRGKLGSAMVWNGITMLGLAGLVGLILAGFGYAGTDTTPPIMVLAMLLIAAGLGEEYAQHERERILVTRRFESYVDPALVKHVMEHPEMERFNGDVREMTVVFTDLDGFTPLSERLGEEIVPLLNEYLRVMTPLIREHNGYRKQWLGDGMMFYYGALENNPQHALHAVTTVLKMRAMMSPFNQLLAGRRSDLREELPPLTMRAGVSTGRMIVGDAGPNDASDYTAIGASVILGARLERANKAMGTRILLSERTVSLLPPDLFLVRPVGKLKVMGMARAEMAYEPLGYCHEATEREKRHAELSRQIVELFRTADFRRCLTAEQQMVDEIGSTKWGELYRQLCRQYLLDPPKAGFAGEITLTAK